MLNLVDTQSIEQLLANLPVGLILIDRNDRVAWINETFTIMSGFTAQDLIGRSRTQLPADLQAVFDADLVTLKHAQTAYRYELAVMPISIGNHTLFYLHDITQVQALREERDGLLAKVAELTTQDAVTGLLNHRAMRNNLEQQASRSRRYGNPLSVLILRLNNLAEYRVQVGAAKYDELMVAVSQTLNDQMRWADVIGRIDDSEFMLILPETQEHAAKELREKINERLHMIPLAVPGFALDIDFGMAQWRKGDDVDMLLERAQRQLGGPDTQKIAV